MELRNFIKTTIREYLNEMKVYQGHKIPTDDIFYHDKENQLFVEEYEDVGVMYHFLMTDAFTLKFGVEALQKHGLAVLRAMIKGCKVALLNNIKYIIRIESDALFGTKSIENLKNIIN